MHSWITDLAKNNNQLTLNNLILPGTHNSACNKLTLDCGFNFPVVSHIIKNWTLNQNWNCYKQLINGVRMLDIDISYINNKFYTSHTFIIGELEELIDELKLYNQQYGDIYILKFICRDNINQDNVNSLANIIHNNFKDKIILPIDYLNVLNTPILNFINNNKNMIIYMEFNNHDFFNIEQYLYSSWTNDNQISDSFLNNIQVLNTINQYKTQNSNILMDINWTLTPTYKEIIYGIFCCCDYNSIRTWIKDYNIMFFDFYNKNQNNFQNVNVVSFDFINEILISKIIALNLKLI